MKTTAYLPVLTISLLTLLLPSLGSAQQERKVQAKIDSIDLEERTNPTFSAGGYSKATGQNHKWLIAAAEYQIRGGKRGWVDNVSFNWHMLILNGDVPRVLTHKTITYQDIYEEDDHYAVVFLRPNAIRRYHDENGNISKRDVVIHLEIKHNGRTLTEQTYNSQNDLPARWWTFSPPKVNVVEHGLLARPETPFAPLDYDFYEFIKPE